jgi:predicted Zn-dependent peptidase
MSNIREDKGYTYGIGSGVIDYHHGCSFVIMTEVGKDVAEATLAEIKKEIEVLQTELVGEEELNLVRNYMMGQLLRSADGPYAMLDMYNGTDIYGLGLEYYDQAIEKINSITAEDLRNLAKEHLNWDNFIVATAG